MVQGYSEQRQQAETITAPWKAWTRRRAPVRIAVAIRTPTDHNNPSDGPIMFHHA